MTELDEHQALLGFAPGFSDVEFEKLESTFNERRARNSDWLISVRK